MQATNGNEIIARPDGIVIEREIRKGDGWVFQIVTAYGPNTYQFLAHADKIVGSEARKWAKEMGRKAGGRITGGGGWNGTPGGGNWAYTGQTYHFA